MLDIHQLNVFLVAAETLNFTQAAKRLHMTQPSVSQHIQALERHFASPLFVRAGRTIEMTEAGLALIPMAREAVRLSTRIEESLASMHGDLQGHLMVGCSTTPGKYVLPQLLARFHNLYPHVRVTCTVTGQNQALSMLANGDVHFALTSLASEPTPELEFCKFITDQVVLIAPLDHPWAQKRQIEPAELHKGTFILREGESGTFSAVRDALANLGISIHDLYTLLTLGNSEAIALAVQEGLGVGFVSQMVVERLTEGRVAIIEILGLEIKRQIHIGRHTRRPATSAQTAFWEFVFSSENPLLVPKPETSNLVKL
jgi:DNA-binding transcriptional LysR family regulator